jgi:hypothetical protein
LGKIFYWETTFEEEHSKKIELVILWLKMIIGIEFLLGWKITIIIVIIEKEEFSTSSAHIYISSNDLEK